MGFCWIRIKEFSVGKMGKKIDISKKGMINSLLILIVGINEKVKEHS